VPGSGGPPVEAEVLRLVEGPLEGTPRDDIGEIDERPGRGGHDDAVAPNALAFERRLVHHHPAALPLLRRGHMNRLTLGLQNSPENGSTEVAERGPLSAREHSRHEMTVTAERQMANGVHAPVHRKKSASPHPPFDRVSTQAQRDELSALDHPMLPARKFTHPPIPEVRRELPVHITGKSRRTPFRPGGWLLGGPE
jgi:hypothetical protein